MTDEEHKIATEQLNNRLRAQKDEGLWFAFYCHFIGFPNINRLDIAKNADKALCEYRERFPA